MVAWRSLPSTFPFFGRAFCASRVRCRRRKRVATRPAAATSPVHVRKTLGAPTVSSPCYLLFAHVPKFGSSTESASERCPYQDGYRRGRIVRFPPFYSLVVVGRTRGLIGRIPPFDPGSTSSTHPRKTVKRQPRTLLCVPDDSPTNDFHGPRGQQSTDRSPFSHRRCGDPGKRTCTTRCLASNLEADRTRWRQTWTQHVVHWHQRRDGTCGRLLVRRPGRR